MVSATSDPASLAAATRDFETNRKLLFSLAYNVVGTVSDAEDVVQETWVAWATTHRDRVANPRAYLVRIAVNQSLARLDRARRDREAYAGLWLPEPLDSEATETRSETASFTMLVVLESLSPLERAVFVLNEGFAFGHNEIAEIIGRSPAAVRQVASRARANVRERRDRYHIDEATHREVTERFLKAALGGDLNALLDILAPDVTMWTDGGGVVPGVARRIITGIDHVARVLTLGGGQRREGLQGRVIAANGGAAALILRDDMPYATVVLDLRPADNRIRTVYNIANPDKLTRFARW
ncbi:sigma-70 family RNA polymerase sigma factor [Nocardia sp. NBC_00511]|uniref:sigma-70 family RNA polymerase sigma factor n=1 Tax=Nocardia sp. NBC_00511 TaxID=2903591 RepID=UPI0030E173A4